MDDTMNHQHQQPDPITLTIHHHGRPIQISLPRDATISDLSEHVSQLLQVPITNQKFLISPKIGLLKPPFDTTTNNLPSLAALADKKIVLMGSTAAELSSLSQSIHRASASLNRGHGHGSTIKPAVPVRRRPDQRAIDDAKYTFMSIRPLPYLPNPDRSEAYLRRLRDDAGIRAAMRRFKFSVGLLTEMDPAMHTTREGKTLGLNRNRGEVIELRLRTDAYDGYVDYKTIRRTLCHELAHNVHGDHDRNFHNLWNEIEKLVNKEDWSTGGHSLSSQVYYQPPGEDEEHYDGGGWTGGEFVLGGQQAGGTSGLSRREIIAQATEARLKLQREASQKIEAMEEHTASDEEAQQEEVPR
jgi:hypothetical protein